MEQESDNQNESEDLHKAADEEPAVEMQPPTSPIEASVQPLAWSSTSSDVPYQRKRRKKADSTRVKCDVPTLLPGSPECPHAKQLTNHDSGNTPVQQTLDDSDIDNIELGDFEVSWIFPSLQLLRCYISACLFQEFSGISDYGSDVNQVDLLSEQEEPSDKPERAVYQQGSSSEQDFKVSSASETSAESDNDDCAKKLAQDFIFTQSLTYAKHNVAKAFYLTARRQRHRIHKMVNEKCKWKSYKSARNRISKSLPKLKIDHYFIDKETGLEICKSSGSLPEKNFLRNNKYDLASTWTRISLAEALKVHSIIHHEGTKQKRFKKAKQAANTPESWKDASSPPVKVTLSMDGVPIDNSSGLTLEILSFKLNDCQHVYPIGIHIGTYKEKNLERIFQPVIDELASLNVQVRDIVADSPQRTTLLNMDAVTGYFGCSQCYARGHENAERKAAGDNKGAAVVWPPETMFQPERTHESWMADIEASKTSKQYGIKGDTPLRKLVKDVVKQVPLDVFHIIHLGMTKRIIKQVLKITPSGASSGIMKEVRQLFDKQIQDPAKIQYPSDFSRRPRRLNMAVYKSSEWRNLTTAAFYLLTCGFEQFHQPAANKLWGYYVFLVKGFLLPNDLYEELKDSCNLKAVMTSFYKLYVRVCKKKTCAPNIHMFHHLLKARDEREFSGMSTEPFEAAYAIIKKSYHPGTKSQGKQMMERLYTLYIAQGKKHSCQRKLRVRPKTKGKYNDSLIVTKNHRFFRVLGKLVSGNYAAKRLVIGQFSYPHAPALPFHKLWTHRLLGEMDALHEVSPDDVIGKAVICHDVITLLTPSAIFG